jgi:hypothetical protein
VLREKKNASRPLPKLKEAAIEAISLLAGVVCATVVLLNPIPRAVFKEATGLLVFHRQTPHILSDYVRAVLHIGAAAVHISWFQNPFARLPVFVFAVKSKNPVT